MKPTRITAIVMAGGEGSRLRPFTEHCPKPALPFGGGYRIIDFVLSNLYNSMVPQACVLLQYQPLSLARHLNMQWAGTFGARGSFVRMLLPGMAGVENFRGTADAVGRSLRCLPSADSDIVAVFAADHVYRMDVRQMAAFHQDHGADVTIAALPVPLASARAFGVIVVDADGRIRGFQEKPARPEPMPGDGARAYVSMGNYLFRPDVLRKALARAKARGGHDFGYDVLPDLIEGHRVFAYDFSGNRVPGLQVWEDPTYWRDVGTVDAYIESQWDLLGPEPRLCLDNPEWPIRGAPVASLQANCDRAHVTRSIIGPDARFQGRALRHSVLQRSARVESGADLDHCIIMEDACIAKGVRLRNCIVGGGNTLTQDMRFDYDLYASTRNYRSTPAGVLVVPPCVPRLGARTAALA